MKGGGEKELRTKSQEGGWERREWNIGVGQGTLSSRGRALLCRGPLSS